MEKINDILIYTFTGTVLLGTVGLLVALFLDSNKEIKKLSQRPEKSKASPSHKKLAHS